MGETSGVGASIKGYVVGFLRNAGIMDNAPPVLDLKRLLSELDADKYFHCKGFRNRELSLTSINYRASFHEDSVDLVQRCLITLGEIPVNRKDPDWWKRPLRKDTSGGFSWGSYGPRTVKGVNAFQNKIGINNIQDGNAFGIESFVALRAAIAARVKNPRGDWRVPARLAHREFIRSIEKKTP